MCPLLEALTLGGGCISWWRSQPRSRLRLGAQAAYLPCCLVLPGIDLVFVDLCPVSPSTVHIRLQPLKPIGRKLFVVNINALGADNAWSSSSWIEVDAAYHSKELKVPFKATKYKSSCAICSVLHVLFDINTIGNQTGVVKLSCRLSSPAKRASLYDIFGPEGWSKIRVVFKDEPAPGVPLVRCIKPHRRLHNTLWFALLRLVRWSCLLMDKYITVS